MLLFTPNHLAVQSNLFHVVIADFHLPPSPAVNEKILILCALGVSSEAGGEDNRIVK